MLVSNKVNYVIRLLRFCCTPELVVGNKMCKAEFSLKEWWWHKIKSSLLCLLMSVPMFAEHRLLLNRIAASQFCALLQWASKAIPSHLDNVLVLANWGFVDSDLCCKRLANFISQFGVDRYQQECLRIERDVICFESNQFWQQFRFCHRHEKRAHDKNSHKPRTGSAIERIRTSAGNFPLGPPKGDAFFYFCILVSNR